MAKPIAVQDVVAAGPKSEERIVSRATLDLGALFEGETADLRTFSSGKMGYGFYGKLKVPGGARVQCSVNLVILESKS